MKFTHLVVLSLALTAFAQSPAKPAKPITPTRAEQGFTMLNATVMVHDEVGDGVLLPPRACFPRPRRLKAETR